MTYPAGPPTPPGAGGPPSMACVRHPDRVTGLSCTRCGRPACTDCLREASVGYQCVDCVGASARTGRRGTTIAGADPTSRPLVVQALIAINLVVFAWTAVQARSIPGNAASDLFDAWALAPGLVAEGEWWRLLTAGFLHIGLLHIAFNMYALWIIGRDMERVLGRGRFLAVYLIALLGGSAAVMVAYPPMQAVAGASGAVFGLMGGLAVLMRRMRVPMGQVIGLIVVNLVISVVVPGVSLVGHLGGLLVGAAATAALVYVPARNRTVVQAMALGGLMLLVIGVSAVAAVAI